MLVFSLLLENVQVEQILVNVRVMVKGNDKSNDNVLVIQIKVYINVTIGWY